MGKLKMVRVDYRLVHGQIVAKWIKFRPVDRLIVADNELIKDEFMSDIYKMAAPGYEVDIVSIDDVQKAIDRKDDDILLIFKDVKSVSQAILDGLVIDSLNVGAIPSNKDRKSVVQGVSLSDDEFEQLKTMNSEGINVFFQPIPENDPVMFETIEKKRK